MAHQSGRGVALAALSEWRRRKRFADSIIQQLLGGDVLSASDRGFATELFYGVLRNLTLLDFWIDRLRSGSLEHASRDLLRLGLYQLFCLRTPSHAAIYETVDLAGRKNRSLINGVLRTALRKFTDLEAAAETESIATRFSHPPFLIDRWTSQYGADAAVALCEWNNQPAPLYARINKLKISTEEFVAKYPTTEALPERTNFVRLSGIPAEALARGECYIQDPSTASLVNCSTRNLTRPSSTPAPRPAARVVSSLSQCRIAGDCSPAIAIRTALPSYAKTWRRSASLRTNASGRIGRSRPSRSLRLIPSTASSLTRPAVTPE